MLPEYVKPQLTETLLDGFIMRTAVETEGLPVSVDTARNACLQYMGHSTVGDKELGAFEKELRQDSNFDNIPALDAVAALSKTVDSYIRHGEEFDYRVEHLRHSKTEPAMEKAGVSCHTPFVEVMLSSLVVSGKRHMEDEQQKILEAAGITAEDVIRVADCFEV